MCKVVLRQFTLLFPSVRSSRFAYDYRTNSVLPVNDVRMTVLGPGDGERRSFVYSFFTPSPRSVRLTT